MPEQSVQLNVGSGGKLVRTVEVTTSAGVVEQQVISLADANGVLLSQADLLSDVLHELHKISGSLQLLLYEFKINADPLEIAS